MNTNEKAEFLANSILKAKMVMEKVNEISPQAGKSPALPGRGLREEDVDRMLDEDPELINEAKAMAGLNATTMQKNISKSRMPESILKSFQENPIIDPTSPFGMDSVMEEVTKKVVPTIQERTEVPKQRVETTPLTMDTKLMEYIIKKTVEETLEQVSKRTAIDETIQIKIGDKVFGGKLTVLKENKKS